MLVDRDWYSTPDAAKLLELTQRQLRALVDSRRLPREAWRNIARRGRRRVLQFHVGRCRAALEEL